jgi:preprotein translocase subunit YajC
VPDLVSLLPLVGIALLFWLLIVRPASKRQKELSRMQSSLKTGDEVMLTSGIFGILREADTDHVHVEIADGVTVKVARGAVGSIAQPALAADEPEEN